MSFRATIVEAMQRVAREHGVALPALSDELPLCDTGFDSLAFAILVARLENDLGIDPVTANDGALPATIGDFVRAYEKVAGEVMMMR